MGESGAADGSGVCIHIYAPLSLHAVSQED